MTRTTINSILLLSVLFLSTPLCGQATAIAPLPTQLTTATTAFLANAGINASDSLEAYNAFYQDLYTWNHFHLQPAPSAAELSFDLQVNVVITYVTGGQSVGTSYLLLNIRDTKTGSLLWTLSEDIRPAGRRKDQLANIAAAATRLLTDLKAISTTSAPQ